MRRALVMIAAATLALGGCGKKSKSKDDDAPNDQHQDEQQPPQDGDAHPGEGEPKPGPQPGPEPGPVVTPILSESEATQSKDGAFWVKVVWADGPRAEEYQKVTLTFADGARLLPTEVKDVDAKSWMPSMGHGGADDDRAVAKDAEKANVYTVSDLWLTMGGAWELRVKATVNGKADTAHVKVDVP